MKEITFSQAINQAFIDSMKVDNKVICMGLVSLIQKVCFGTTLI